MNAPKHWQDPVNACVGVMVLMSPWLAGYALVQPALANAVIVGTILFTVSVAAAVIGRPWVEWVIVATGAWMLAAPWALALTDARSRIACVVLGSLVLLLGAAALGRELLGRMRGGVGTAR
jgi:hypothetical protein